MSTTTPQSLKPKDIVKPDDVMTWELAWTMGVTPWDAGDIQPSLREALALLALPKQAGRALVPGCGSGYDLPYIAAQTGLSTVGLDISETARKRCEEMIQKVKSQDPSIQASFEISDFFKYDPPRDQLFDLVYDHTFFVAIPPALRMDWGKQMAKLIKPGGHLITVVYPIDPYVETGPPYYVRQDHYVEPLGNDFSKILDKVPEKSSENHKDREHLIIWRRL